MARVRMQRFTRQYKDSLQGRFMILISFVSKLLKAMCESNYYNIRKFDKVMAKIKWCSFLPHSVV